MRYRPTDRPTDTAYYRDARTHLKTTEEPSGDQLNFEFFILSHFTVLDHFI